jgi:hypothetical protein
MSVSYGVYDGSQSAVKEKEAKGKLPLASTTSKHINSPKHSLRLL